LRNRTKEGTVSPKKNPETKKKKRPLLKKAWCERKPSMPWGLAKGEGGTCRPEAPRGEDACVVRGGEKPPWAPERKEKKKATPVSRRRKKHAGPRSRPTGKKAFANVEKKAAK